MKYATKLFIALAGATAVALSLSACSSTPSAAPSDSGAPAPVAIQIGVGADAAYAPFFVADQEGIFADAGLEVTLVPFASGGDALSAVSAGQVALTMSSPATITSIMANNDAITAFAQTVDLGRYNKAVLRDGVASAADVKKFGYVAGLSQYMAYTYFEENGVDPESIEWITGTAQDLTALLQRGDIDGFFLWEPWPTNAVKAGTGEIAATAAELDGLTIVNWLATTHEWLDANDETAARVAGALEKAIDVIDQSPETAAKAVEKAVTIAQADAEGMLAEMDFGMKPITSDDVAAVTKIGEFFVSTGAIDAVPDLSKDLVLDWTW